jgi:hypothetical protein
MVRGRPAADRPQIISLHDSENHNQIILAGEALRRSVRKGLSLAGRALGKKGTLASVPAAIGSIFGGTRSKRQEKKKKRNATMKMLP